MPEAFRGSVSRDRVAAPRERSGLGGSDSRVRRGVPPRKGQIEITSTFARPVLSQVVSNQLVIYLFSSFLR
jgi:hypothetical protein